MDTALNHRGIYHQLKTYHGYDHTPWDTSHVLRVDIDTIARNFLYEMICNEFPLPASNSSPALEPSLQLYPNPAFDCINIETIDLPMRTIIVYDAVGKKIEEHNYEGKQTTTCSIQTAHWPEGLFVVRGIGAGNRLLEEKRVIIARPK